MLIRYLDVLFFWKISIQVACPFENHSVIFLSGVFDFLIYSKNHFLFYSLQISPPFSRLSLHSVECFALHKAFSLK